MLKRNFNAKEIKSIERKAMKEKRKHFSGQIVIIIILMFVFSFLCWKQFFQNAKNMVFLAHEDETLSKLEIFDEYIDTVDSFWYDQIYEKKNLNAMHSMYTYYTLKEIPDEQVVAGKEDWLFYVEKIDSDSIAEYEGTDRYTEAEMQEFLVAALANQNRMGERGIQTAVLVAPNKENVYAEYMPDRYIHNPVSNTDLLVEYLQKQGIGVLSPKEELCKLRSEKQLYYTYDSHWNQLGAYVGAKQLLDFWGIPMDNLLEREITSYALNENYHEGAWSDLAHMAGLNYVFEDEIEYEVQGTVQIDWNQYAVEQFSKQVSHYTNEKALLAKKIFLIGDSFRTAMIPALSEVFQEVYVIHRSDYTPEMLETVSPDYVVVEYVERYVGQMKDFYLY